MDCSGLIAPVCSYVVYGLAGVRFVEVNWLIGRLSHHLEGRKGGVAGVNTLAYNDALAEKNFSGSGGFDFCRMLDLK